MSLLRVRKCCWWIPEQIRRRGHKQAHDHVCRSSIRLDRYRIEPRASLYLTSPCEMGACSQVWTSGMNFSSRDEQVSIRRCFFFYASRF